LLLTVETQSASNALFVRSNIKQPLANPSGVVLVRN
jgi:hypothetical protein